MTDLDDPLADPAAGACWEDLPQAWKERYAADHGLGLHEWEQALRRARADQTMSTPRGHSRYRGAFRGPGG